MKKIRQIKNEQMQKKCSQNSSSNLFKIVALLLFFNSVFISSGVCQRCSDINPAETYCHYAYTYPDRERPEWGNEVYGVGGIAHDSLSWYIASLPRDFEGRAGKGDWQIWRIPVSEDIAHFNKNLVKTVKLSTLPPGIQKYNHIGDIDCFMYEKIDYLALPLYGDNTRGIIAFLRAKDLSYVNYAILPPFQTGPGWCAISNDGYLYTSNDEAEFIRRYQISWDTILHTTLKVGLTLKDSFVIRDSNGPIVLRNMQGGEFTQTGNLFYASCGIVYCNYIVGKQGEANEEDGIHVFETSPSNWTEVLKSTNSNRDGTTGTFDYAFDNTNCNDEPEGLTIWDIDNMKAPHPKNIAGHLHVLVSNHNKWQIIRNISEFVPGVNITYKAASSIASFFKGHKVHTSKVSIHHFGPSPYNSDIDGGGGFVLTEQDKIDIALLEEAYKILQGGDTLGMLKYLASQLDESGNPIIPGIANPSDKIIQVFPDKTDKLMADKGHWMMPQVTTGTKTCTNPFGMNIYDGLSIQKSKINSQCRSVGSISHILSLPTSGKRVPRSEYILDFIPVLLPTSNDYLDRSSPFPFSIYNYWNDWMYEGDSYFTVTHEEIKKWGTCASHNGYGHPPYSYFLGPESDFSCGNFRSFMENRNKTPMLKADKKITYPLFRFSFFIPLTNGVYVTNSTGSWTPLLGINLKWLQGANNPDHEQFQSFFYNLAVIASADAAFKILEPPQIPGIPRAVVTGSVNGQTYIAGIDDLGIFSPVDCGNGKETALLVQSLLTTYDSDVNNPLRKICKKYMEDQGQRDVIKAYVPSSYPGKGLDPNEMKSLDSYINSQSKFPTSVKFLVEKENGTFVINDNTNNEESVTWYNKVSKYNNKHLMRWAILNQDIAAFDIEDGRIILAGEKLKSTFAVCVNKSEILEIIDLASKIDRDNSLSPEAKKERKQIISNNYYQAALMNYYSEKIIIQNEYSKEINDLKCSNK